jgi:pseudaminic acid biosynthesis-associated methylase
MKTVFKTEQEDFWAGEFGNKYIQRNNDDNIIAGNIALFSQIFEKTNGIKTVLEYGANVGLNIVAIKQLLPNVETSAVEINTRAVNELKKIANLKTYHKSILDFKIDYKRDFVFTCGVLIHINPDFLPQVYELIYNSSNRYIFMTEYYNPIPIEVQYRNNSNKLFKRDFAGEMLDKFQDLTLVDYGFCYHRDYNFSKDDSTWFLLEKKLYKK